MFLVQRKKKLRIPRKKAPALKLKETGCLPVGYGNRELPLKQQLLPERDQPSDLIDHSVIATVFFKKNLEKILLYTVLLVYLLINRRVDRLPSHAHRLVCAVLTRERDGDLDHGWFDGWATGTCKGSVAYETRSARACGVCSLVYSVQIR